MKHSLLIHGQELHMGGKDCQAVNMMFSNPHLHIKHLTGK
jgi:hypothetical protein